MPLRLYLNHNVPRGVSEGLALVGVDALTALADGAAELPDDELLDRAAALGRVLVSMDVDLVREAVRRQRAGEPFPGVVFGHQLDCSIGHFVRDLELLTRVCEPEDLEDRVEFLPL